MLTDLLYTLPVRAEASLRGAASSSSSAPRSSERARTVASSELARSFRSLVSSFTHPSSTTDDEVRNSESPKVDTATPREQTITGRGGRYTDNTPTAPTKTGTSSYQRGASATSGSRSDTTAHAAILQRSQSQSPSGAKDTSNARTGVVANGEVDLTKNQIHPLYGVPMVSQAAKDAYIHFSQQTGHVWNSSAGPDANQGEFATTTYRVPSWGVQDFVTSDGVRHRFDVGLVYTTRGSEGWNGMDVNEIHPEVEAYVLTQFQQDLSEAGIPASDISSVSAIRVHGGTTKQEWFVDVLRVTKTSGESIYPQMNVAMRDPKHVMELIQDFVGADIPT